MNRVQYLASVDVSSFVTWLATKSEQLKVNLKIPKSKYVSQTIDKVVVGLPNLVGCYNWKARWTDDEKIVESSCWDSTVVSLEKLSGRLQAVVSKPKSNADALKVLHSVLKWGGDRNVRVGAGRFVGTHDDICGYLRTYAEVLRLDRAEVDPTEAGVPALRPPVMMNAMLTKVHSLLAEDGLPIYDSRVAGAMATLVALYATERRSAGVRMPGLPRLLEFPLTDRDSRRRVPADLREFSSFTINRDQNARLRAAAQWTSAKIRLGWILQAVLEAKPSLFSQYDPRLRMRAFEASLFMAGYDTNSFSRI